MSPVTTSHVAHRHAERVGDDLREGGEVSLPLRADAGGDAHLAARLDLHARALVGADAGALDVTDDADADVAALGAMARLLLGEERVVADHLGRLLEHRQVVAAVVGERGEVLEDDAVVVRELVGRQEVAAADLDPVEAELARREVEQPLHHEHAVLAAGAAYGVTIGLVVKTAVNSES